tara:strand:- start:2043 stop:2819 length:777 start_codon:yes stop_codon:yes gene_type:complete
MAKFNLDDYELVEDRLKKYWKDNPEGNINTHIEHITEDGTCVTIKAGITDNNGRLVATGIAQETKGDGFANTTSWVENCETSAIGRALANWKYQGNKKARPSREEMAKVQRNSVTPTTDKKEKDIAQEDGKKAMPPSSTSPIEQIKEAGFGDTKGSKHPNGALAIDEDGLICPCGSNARVKYYKAHEKSKPKSPDFRCQAMGQCTAGDTVDGKVFAKSWWMDNKETPEAWKDYAAVQNGMSLPKAKSLDDIKPGEAPF